MSTNGRRTAVVCCSRAAILVAMWTALAWTCCADAAESNDWRPCRAAGHRRFDEDVIRNYGGGGPGHVDFTGGGGDGGDDDDGETDADDDYKDDDGGGGGGGDTDGGYFRIPVDDKPKRGASKLYEKKADLHRPVAPAPYTADSASSGNGLRVDTTLLRGETIELPTYVNVPVTLKCRFEPVDGTEDKFDTVVEAMYPGHRDALPPPPGSHASRILKQLMGSVDGWRGVTHNSLRSVRRASENRFGRREWPARDDEDGDGSSTAQREDGNDQVAWKILARQRAAERMRRIHDSRQDFGWPERFHGQAARLLQQRFDDFPVPVRKMSKNQLFEDREAEQYAYDQGVDDRQAEQGYDQQEDGRQAEQGYDQQIEPQTDDSQQVESVDDSRQIESGDDSQQVEIEDDSQRVESVVDSQQVEIEDDTSQVERVDGQQVGGIEDRAAAEEVDDRRVQDGNLPSEVQELKRDMTATNAPEIDTAVISDFAKFRKGIPVRTLAEHEYTTDSTL